MRVGRYSAAIRTAAPTTGTAYATIIAASKPLVIREIGITLAAATSSGLGLVRTLTAGTASTSTNGQPHNPAGATVTGTIKSAWSVAPTIAVSPVYLRRVEMPAAAGATVVWTFDGNDDALIVVPSATGGLVLWNFLGTTASAVDLHVTWDEGL